MTPLAQKIVERIRRERLTPLPGWHFAIIRAGWQLGMVSLALVASLVTVLSFHIVFEIKGHAGGQGESVLNAPVLFTAVAWIVLVFLMALGVAFCARHIRRGYQYTLLALMAVFFLATLFLSLALEFSRFDDPMEKFFLPRISPEGQYREL